MRKFFFLIDDDADDRELFCEVIGEIDPEILCYSAFDGRSAISKLTGKEIERPDIIFLDINMPVIDGWQCLKILKADDDFRNIPVIMYSTSSYSEDIAKAHSAGAVCLFTKPGNYKDLVKSLELVVNYLIDDKLSKLPFCSPSFKAIDSGQP